MILPMIPLRTIKRFRRSQTKIWLALGVVAMSTVLLIAVTHKTRLLISPSKSLPYSVFLLLKGISAQKGDFITIQGHKTAYFDDLLFTKQIVGIPGDVISFKEEFVWINDQKMGLFLTLTKKGQPLTPLKTRVIPHGYLFVMGEDERSFDSRYEEFGLVAEKHILTSVRRKQGVVRGKQIDFMKRHVNFARFKNISKKPSKYINLKIHNGPMS